MKYFTVGTIDEALTILKDFNGNARLIAGGTDVVVDMSEGKLKTDALVDITRIKEMTEITVVDNKLFIGGACTLSNVSNNENVIKYAPSLAKAASSIGSKQIDNIATLTGNVVSAQPAADGAMALSGLGATIHIQGFKGEKILPINDCYAGFGKSTIDSTKEIVTKIEIDCQDHNEASAFERLELRKQLALPMLNVCVMAHIENNKFVWVRIAMGPVGVGPVRAKNTEMFLQNKDVTDEIIKEASLLVLEEANPRTNPLRGTREYRIQTLPVLVRRALNNVVSQICK